VTATSGDEEMAGDGTDASYVFAAADVPVAVAIVDAAFSAIDFGYATVLRIKEAAVANGVGNTSLEMELIHAAGHELQREIAGKPGCELGRPELDDLLRWPRPIAQTPDDVVRLWREISGGAAAYGAIARFEDLLFTKRDGNGRDRVRRATTAYLAAVDAADTIDMDVVDALLRVWSLARAVREPDVDTEVRRRMALSALAAGPLQAGPPRRRRTTSQGRGRLHLGLSRQSDRCRPAEPSRRRRGNT
jgi:hypothetical protein